MTHRAIHKCGNVIKSLSKCYQIVIIAKRKGLDNTRYARFVTSAPEVKRFQRMNLSNFQKLKDKKKIKKLFVIVALVLITQGNTYAHANQSSDHYKLYLHSKIVNYKQFICAVAIGHQESRWNWRATNGNHYGIFQMNNKKVKYMNPYQQIDWWLRYIKTRYDNKPCKALAHLKNRNWH